MEIFQKRNCGNRESLVPCDFIHVVVQCYLRSTSFPNIHPISSAYLIVNEENSSDTTIKSEWTTYSVATFYLVSVMFLQMVPLSKMSSKMSALY